MLISVKDWVKSNLDKYKYTSLVRERYDEFKEQTGSDASYNSFKKEISRAFRRFNKGQWVKGDPEGNEVYDPVFVEERSEFIEEDANNAHAYSQSSTIRSLDDLITACNIDLSVWDVIAYKIKKQDLGVKDKEGELQWDEGKMTGHVKYGRVPVVTAMYHIQATLQRRILINPTFELPRPIHIDYSGLKQVTSKAPSEDGLNCAMILSDAQMTYRRNVLTGELDPVHDRKVMLLSLKIAQEAQPDEIIYNGDFFDLPDWSDKFISSPDMVYTLQPALIEFSYYHYLLKKICPNASFTYIPGNHCQRLENSIMRNVASAYGVYRVDDSNRVPVFSLKNLLAHDTNGITFEESYPIGCKWLNNKLRIGHGDVAKNKSGASVNSVISDTTYSQVFGHIHRVELAFKTIDERGYTVPIHAASFGTMSRVEDGVVPSNKSRHNWQQGFGLEYYDDDVTSYPVPLLCIDGRTLFKGKEFIIDEEEVSAYNRGLQDTHNITLS